ncbi:MAG: MoaD/ThiS family protein [archaeon]|nr:MoaD/ThiS family protein [archaeon]MCP8305650.1 MoaD/ThiS family protein [archaeon]
MKIKVKFFGVFRELFGGREREIELENGFYVRDLLDLLCDSYELREKVFDKSGRLKDYVTILKNRSYTQSLKGVWTELEEGDVVAILPPVTGG